MIIETASFSQASKHFTGEEPPEFLELGDDLFFRADAPARYDVTAQVVSEELIVSGVLSIELSCRCARCDQWALCLVSVNDFLRSYKLKIKNESIDLTDDMREDILLALPISFVCSPACSGLCCRCGVNLNKKKCDCEGQDGFGVWDDLKKLNLRG